LWELENPTADKVYSSRGQVVCLTRFVAFADGPWSPLPIRTVSWPTEVSKRLVAGHPLLRSGSHGHPASARAYAFAAMLKQIFRSEMPSHRSAIDNDYLLLTAVTGALALVGGSMSWTGVVTLAAAFTQIAQALPPRP
jgi:hypothetical protein